MLLPIPNPRTIALVKGFGLMLLYQIWNTICRYSFTSRHPFKLESYCSLDNMVVPQVPCILQHPIHLALDKDNLQCMPRSFLPTTLQSTTTKPGVINVHDYGCQTLVKTRTRQKGQCVASLFPVVVRGVHDLEHPMSFQHRLAKICIFEIRVHVLSLTSLKDLGNFFLRFWPYGEQTT